MSKQTLKQVLFESELYPFDSMENVRFDDLNFLVDKLNEAIRRVNDHEKRVGTDGS